MSNALLLLSPDALETAFPESVQSQIRAHADRLDIISPAAQWRDHRALLREADVIFSGWGAPVMDDEFLRHAPALQAVFYAGGSVRSFVTDAFWHRKVRLTTAQAINAIPVAEFTVAALTLGLKRVWHYARLTAATRTFPEDRPLPGTLHSTVGLVSYGTIARQVRTRLRTLDVKVLVYDPFLSAEQARADDMQKVSLEELFAQSDAVSIHTPNLLETRQLIKGTHVAAMRPGAFFLNTARGEVIDEPALIKVLQQRPDLQVLLDVTDPEPPANQSPLYDLPNVVLTPHIAGSIGVECERMGQAMVDEFLRFKAGTALRWSINIEDSLRIA